MEKRINSKIDAYFQNFKNNISELIKQQCDESTHIVITNYMNTYKKLQLETEDFTKRKRVKNIVPYYDRCCAYRANGERCTRRKKNDEKYCGTHIKGQPHGIVTDNDDVSVTKFKKITVRQQDIKGIIYYIDDNNNVYDPHDIMNCIKNPKVIAKYKKIDDNTYHIPSFGIE